MKWFVAMRPMPESLSRSAMKNWSDWHRKTRDIDLTRFVKEDAIPPLYFERGYFLTPAGNSEKAYRLLAEAMKERGDVGVATFVMRGKERPVAIFSDNGILRAETMRFADEVRIVQTGRFVSEEDCFGDSCAQI